MSIVLIRRPPTIACRRFVGAAPFCCALIRLPSMLHPANITPPAAAAFLRKSLRLVMTTLQVQCTSRLTVQQLAGRELSTHFRNVPLLPSLEVSPFLFFSNQLNPMLRAAA